MEVFQSPFESDLVFLGLSLVVSFGGFSYVSLGVSSEISLDQSLWVKFYPNFHVTHIEPRARNLALTFSGNTGVDIGWYTRFSSHLLVNFYDLMIICLDLLSCVVGLTEWISCGSSDTVAVPCFFMQK